MDDLISRQAAIEAITKCRNESVMPNMWYDGMNVAINCIHHVPSAQPESLTDKEQRIFLAAMERELKVCIETDREFTREPYEDSLVHICKEIERKVKGALWT